MLGKLFSFRGRMGRLAYLGWIVVAAILGSVFVTVLILAGVLGGAANGVGVAVAGGAVAALVGMLPLLWSCCALAAKRLRDAGFAPLLVLPAVTAFSLFDALVLSRHIGTVGLSGVVHNSPVGFGVNAVLGFVLLLWPSAGDAPDEEGRQEGIPWHERALAASPAIEPQAPLPAIFKPIVPAPSATAASFPANVGPRPFGRRGT